MFDCRACPVLKDENAWLRKQLQEMNDRFQALTGTLSEVANNRIDDAPDPDPQPTGAEDDEGPSGAAARAEWADAELEREALRLKGKGVIIQPDFQQ